MENLIRKVILILEDEVKQGYLTEREFDDYISLIRHASEITRMQALLEKYHIPVTS